jgi:1-deoxy-D-xylulose-5-phosphate reductoisomerase
VVLNAANEIAVDAFLGGQLTFTGIPRLIARVMDAHRVQGGTSLEIVREADRWAREYARTVVESVQLKV